MSKVACSSDFCGLASAQLPPRVYVEIHRVYLAIILDNVRACCPCLYPTVRSVWANSGRFVFKENVEWADYWSNERVAYCHVVMCCHPWNTQYDTHAHIRT